MELYNQLIESSNSIAGKKIGPWKIPSIDDIYQNHLVVIFLILLVIAFTVDAYMAIRSGAASIVPDAKHVWLPMSEAIVNGSEPYTDIPDNKPPLFILLVALGGIFGFTTLMYVVTLVSNLIIISEVYNYGNSSSFEYDGKVAAAVIAGSILFMNVEYSVINNKSIALAIFLISLRYTNPVKLGAGIAISGLFAQLIVVAIPAVVLKKISTLESFLKFSAAGIICAILGYLSIFLIWGTDTGINSLRQSFVVFSYVAGTSNFGNQVSLWSATDRWLQEVMNLQKSLIIPTVAALLASVNIARSKTNRETVIQAFKKYRFEYLLLFSFTFLVFVRPWWHYSYFPLVPLSIIIGGGFSNITKKSRRSTSLEMSHSDSLPSNTDGQSIPQEDTVTSEVERASTERKKSTDEVNATEKQADEGSKENTTIEFKEIIEPAYEHLASGMVEEAIIIASDNIQNKVREITNYNVSIQDDEFRDICSSEFKEQDWIEAVNKLSNLQTQSIYSPEPVEEEEVRAVLDDLSKYTITTS